MQAAGIRAAQLHLPLYRHVPLTHPIEQPPVLFQRLAVTGGHEHMVVGGEGADTFCRVASKNGDGRRRAEGVIPNTFEDL